MTTSFNVNVNDLQYILRQIKIAEASSAAYSSTPKSILQAIMDAYGVTAVNAAQLPAGLRTVDGTFNNLLPGLSEAGAADNLFPRLTDPNFRTVDGPGIDFNGDGFVDVVNPNYGVFPDASPAPGLQPGVKSVADSDPRTISNLIVDMTPSNPAAIEAFVNNPLSMEYIATYLADNGLPAVAEANVATWLADPLNVAVATDIMKTIPNQSPDIGLSPGFNSWMTFFGQFFDHGLDLVTKGSNGTVYIPLQADDPLYDKGADGLSNNVVDAYFVTEPILGDPLPAVSSTQTAWPAFYAVDTTNWPPGAPPPAYSATDLGFGSVKINDDGAGADGIFGTADDRPNFMALTRATVTLDANGIPQTENTTTSWIDQNQTYTSHASHQVFLREYDRVGNLTFSTGRLLDGQAANGSLDGAIGNWAEVKAQAKEMLGIILTDFDVHNVPLLKTDQYGKFIPGPNGYAQVATSTGFVEGTATGLDLTAIPNLVRTGHAFLNDIAHHAAPAMVDHDHNPATAKIQQLADADDDVNGNGVYDVGTDILTDVNEDGSITTADFFADDHNDLTYDNEMLDSHFVTGDGRGNENIALTSVHSIFHSEHNRLVEVNKQTLLANAAATPAGLTFLNEWLLVDVAAVPTTPEGIAALVWDGERLFQAARFGTEMQYQHLVFEEFARRIQPQVDPFIFNSSPNIDPSIVAEFAHTVYRFGHSMLTGTVDRLDNNLDPVNGTATQESLLAAFLNPQMYVATGSTVEAANANLIRALSRDVGNAIDEFIVPDVRSTLLGLPLDLAALNIARGRETGIPSLNETRKQLYEGGDPQPADLKPYDSWAEFGAHLKNPASLVNFIAAYGTHATITAAATLEEMRTAAANLMAAAIAGDNSTGAVDFIFGAGSYATSGLNDVDLWIGGLAEAHPEFGGMLGSTFNYIFEAQMENLQFGDRMYYLTRTQGLNILNNLEPNTFSDLVMRNTELGGDYATHLNGALFVTPDYILEMDTGIAQEDYNGALTTGLDPLWGLGEVHSSLIPKKVMRTLGTDTDTTNGNMAGDGHLEGGTIRFTGGEHVVVGGTEGNDKIYSDRGIDTVWGDGGNDYINAGTESDDVFGGEGDDIIEDPFGDDVLRGNQGNDVISEARGADLVFGDEGQDYLILGQDAAEAFGGEGNDFILGGAGKDFLLGNEGDDWIEGGAGFDTIAGDNSELFFNSSIIGHDVLFHGSDEGDYDAESGDDIMGSGPSVFRYEGMFGFDWGIAKNDITGVNFDLQIPIFTTVPNDVLRDRFDQVEALSGWKYSDVLDGDDRGHKGGGSSAPDSVPVELFADHLLTQEGVDRIAGFNQWFGGYNGTTDLTDVRNTLFGGFSGVPGSTPITTWRDGNILMGGSGSDFLRGRGGYDLLDGDAWLNVRIKIVVPADVVVNGVTYPAGTYSAESMSTDTVLSGDYAGKVFNTDADGKPIFTSPAFGGATLNSLMLNGTINPGNMSIVRELMDTSNDALHVKDVDTAIFQGQFFEYEVEGSKDLNGDGDFDDAKEFGYVGLDDNGVAIDTRARDVNGDGFISVRDRDTGAVGASHNSVPGASSRGNLTDDTDFVKNIEQLQFADGIKVIAGGNNLATGTVTIDDMTPFVGQVLKATLSNFADVEGIPLGPNGLPIGLQFEWQTTEFGNNSGWSTIEINNGNYTVRSVDPGHVLRAVARFNDAAGNPERIISDATDNPTAAFVVDENAAAGTVVGARIPFSIDYDPTSFNGNPPPDVDLALLVHEIDPANNAGGRFTVIRNGFDFQGTPLYQLVVNPALNNTGPLDALDTRVLLNYEAGIHSPANLSYQTPDNQYQVVINSYSDAVANGGVLVAQRIFTVKLNDVEPEIVDIAPVLDLNADATVTVSTNGQYLDNFNTAALNNSNGTTAWATTPWVESGDGVNSASTGQIQIDGGGFGGTNELRFLGGTTAGVFDGATITRTVNLAGVTSATLSFDVDQNNIDTGETVTVLFAADGVNFTQTVQTITNASSSTGATTSVSLTGPFTANSAIRFVATGINQTNEDVRIDNVNVATVTTANVFVPGVIGNNYATTYTENGAGVAIASNPSVTDADNASLMGATVRLTNAQVGDVLAIAGTLPAGITSSFGPAVAGEITMYLSGPASAADFQTAIGQVRFGNPAENTVTSGVRTINVTVNDGEKESPVATASVTVTGVDDPTVYGTDSIITNTALGTAFVIPEWALLANDTDPDSILDVTSLPTSTGVTTSLLTNPGSVTITDTTPANGSFTYNVSPTVANGTVNVTSIGQTENVNVRDQFGNNNYGNNNGSVNWAGNWAETGDDNSANNANGQIRINNGNLVFDAGINAAASDGASILRTVNLAGATNATLSYNFAENNLDAGESVLVEFSDDGSFSAGHVQLIQTITSATNGTIGTSLQSVLLTGAFTANAAVRFTASAMNLDTDTVNIDNVNIAFTRPLAVNGNGQANILIGDINGSTFNGNGGNDTILAGGGNDTINWGIGDGRDFMDGGAGTLDRVVINGDNQVETFNVYSNTDDWDNNAANGIVSSAAHAGFTGLNANTEIVITRDGAVIAELDNIEEIFIDTSGGNDTVNAIGNFNPTSLAFNTITINGGEGNDTVDISGLTSDHRVVLNTGGGTDAIVGGTRPQDVVNVTAPVVVTNPGNGTDNGNGHTPGHPRSLGSADDNQDNTIEGDDSDDIINTGAGSDILRGRDGDDSMYGGAGDDRLVGGRGVDKMWGGADDDSFVFTSNSHTGIGAGHRDVIKDFSTGDVIDLSGYKGTFKFLGEGALTGGAQNQVHLVFKGGNTIIQVDNDNNKDVDAEIELTGIHHLEARDFAL